MKEVRGQITITEVNDGESVSIDADNSFVKYANYPECPAATSDMWVDSIDETSLIPGDTLWTWVHTAYTDGNSTDAFMPSYYGYNGYDAAILSIDNEHEDFLYDDAGNRISGHVKTNARLNIGGSNVTAGITWRITSASGTTMQNSGNAITNTSDTAYSGSSCWITTGGVLHVNGITGDASITVTAEYNNETYFVIFKAKRLSDDKYDLKLTPNSIAYNPATYPDGGKTIAISAKRTDIKGNTTDITFGSYSNASKISQTASKGILRLFRAYITTEGTTGSLSQLITNVLTVPEYTAKGYDGYYFELRKYTTSTGSTYTVVDHQSIPIVRSSIVRIAGTADYYHGDTGNPRPEASESELGKIVLNDYYDESDGTLSDMIDVCIDDGGDYLWDASDVAFGTCYIYRGNGHLYEATETGWLDLGLFKGESPYNADLDNEMDSVACDSGGKPIDAQSVSANVGLYYGTERKTPRITKVVRKYGSNNSSTKTWTSSASTHTNGVYPSWNGGALTINYSTAAVITGKDLFEVTVQDNADPSVERTLTLTVNGIKGNATYNLVTSKTAIKKSGSNYTPSSVSCEYRKYDVNKAAFVTASGGTIMYMKDGEDTEYSYTSVLVPGTDFTTNVTFELYVNGYVVDRETVPVIEDGVQGVSPYEADLGNEMDSITCNNDGHPTIAQSVMTHVSLYHGTVPKTFSLNVYDNSPSGDQFVNGVQDDDVVPGVKVSWKPVGTGELPNQSLSDGDVLVEFDTTAVFTNGKYTVCIEVVPSDTGVASRYLYFTINGIMSPVVYNLLPSMSVINVGRTDDGGYDPATVALKCGYTKKGVDGVTSVEDATGAIGGEYSIFFRNRKRDGGNEATDGFTRTIGTGTATNANIPLHSYYKYNLIQQIYTADEVGADGFFKSISFYNNGSEKTRTLKIYLVNTQKVKFVSTSDWISITEADLFFSGSVVFEKQKWNTIILDKSFYYEGNNLAVIIDDNTGSYSSGLSCYVFSTTDENSNAINQALYVHSDSTNYEIANPSYTGTLLSVKNQIKFDEVFYFRYGVSENKAMLSTFDVAKYSAVEFFLYKDVVNDAISAIDSSKVLDKENVPVVTDGIDNVKRWIQVSPVEAYVDENDGLTESITSIEVAFFIEEDGVARELTRTEVEDLTEGDYLIVDGMVNENMETSGDFSIDEHNNISEYFSFNSSDATDSRMYSGVSGLVNPSLQIGTKFKYLRFYWLATNIYTDPTTVARYDIAEVIVSKQGTTGQKGSTGKMFYSAGDYESKLYQSDEYSTPLVHIINGSTDEWYWLDAPDNTNPQGGYYPPVSSSPVWKKALNEWKVVMTEALFTDFAKMGSAIISGDFLFSMNGYIDGVHYNSGASYSAGNDSRPAYMRFAGIPNAIDRLTVQMESDGSQSYTSTSPKVLFTFKMASTGTIQVRHHKTGSNNSRIALRAQGTTNITDTIIVNTTTNSTISKVLSAGVWEVVACKINDSTSTSNIFSLVASFTFPSGSSAVGGFFKPCMWMDLRTGEISAANGNFVLNADGSVTAAAGNFTIDSLGNVVVEGVVKARTLYRPVARINIEELVNNESLGTSNNHIYTLDLSTFDWSFYSLSGFPDILYLGTTDYAENIDGYGNYGKAARNCYGRYNIPLPSTMTGKMIDIYSLAYTKYSEIIVSCMGQQSDGYFEAIDFVGGHYNEIHFNWQQPDNNMEHEHAVAHARILSDGTHWLLVDSVYATLVEEN